MKDGKEGELPVSGSVAPGLASQQGVVLGARSQACCHAEAFTGTQRKIEGCWQQVAALIHPATVSAQPPSFSVSLGAASIGTAGFRTRVRGALRPFPPKKTKQNYSCVVLSTLL